MSSNELEKASLSNVKQGDEVYGDAAVTRGGSGAFAEMAFGRCRQ